MLQRLKINGRPGRLPPKLNSCPETLNLRVRPLACEFITKNRRRNNILARRVIEFERFLINPNPDPQPEAPAVFDIKRQKSPKKKDGTINQEQGAAVFCVQLASDATLIRWHLKVRWWPLKRHFHEQFAIAIPTDCVHSIFPVLIKLTC